MDGLESSELKDVFPNFNARMNNIKKQIKDQIKSQRYQGYAEESFGPIQTIPTVPISSELNPVVQETEQIPILTSDSDQKL